MKKILPIALVILLLSFLFYLLHVHSSKTYKIAPGDKYETHIVAKD
jgi:hypothetical protein